MIYYMARYKYMVDSCVLMCPPASSNIEIYIGDMPILYSMPSRGEDRWIQQTDMKEGALSRQLGIPEKDNIPMALLTRIKNAPIGTTVVNPTTVGKSRIKVTPLLKKRAVMAHTMKGFKADASSYTKPVVFIVIGITMLAVLYALNKKKEERLIGNIPV